MLLLGLLYQRYSHRIGLADQKRYAMNIFLGLCLGILIAPLAFAGTDFTCMSDCQTRGYQYQLCSERCSYGVSGGGNSGGYAGGYLQGQQAIKQNLQIQELKMRNQMIQNADAACRNGVQKACDDLRMMLFTK